ncbi:MAG: YceI family protein [Bacteroidota bacterium]|nr:YceI family protein [Bacteroidota bacterium]
MKKLKAIVALVVVSVSLLSFKQTDEKLISKKSQIDIFSHTDAEDISAVNYAATATLSKESGDVVVSVPMQSFEFKKALMQKHFNSEKFLDTKAFPKAKFKGKITNLKDINFSKDGVYNATVSGEMTIKETTNPVNEKGTITVKGGQVTVNTKLKIVLADYKIAFEKGKPSKNIAKTIDITMKIEY